MLVIAVIGYAAAFAGFSVGAAASFFTSKLGKRFQGSLLGFTGGILIAFICFEIIPNAFQALDGGLVTGIFGIAAGVAFCALGENLIRPRGGSGLMLVLAAVVHNFPEGVALGALLSISFPAGVKLAAVIAVHCLPEAVAIFASMKRKRRVYMFLLPAAMGLGTFAGAALSGISPAVLCLSLGFSGGVMLYVTCGDVLPEAKTRWKGRFSSIFACLGFIAGVLLTAFL